MVFILITKSFYRFLILKPVLAMKKKLNKLQLKKKAVSLLDSRMQQNLKGGVVAATRPYYTCPFTCGPTWQGCPPPLDPTTDCF